MLRYSFNSNINTYIHPSLRDRTWLGLHYLIDFYLIRLSQDSVDGGMNSPMMSTLPRKFRTRGGSSPLSSQKFSSSIDSPNIGVRQRGRERNVSFVNPSPLVKIVLDGISSKVSYIVIIVVWWFTNFII